MRNFFTKRCYCMLCLSYLFGTTSVFAQSSVPSPDLNAISIEFKVEKKSMPEVIADLSRKIGRSILVDDTPLRKSADFNLHGTAREALAKVADAFDYSWTESKSGVILMSKRFHDPDEYPQIHLADMQVVAKDAYTVLRFFPEVPTNGLDAYKLNRLYTLFTASQLEVLHSDKPLYGRQLTPEQHILLVNAIADNLAMNSQQTWLTLFYQLNQIPHSMVTIRKQTPPKVLSGEDQKEQSATAVQRLTGIGRENIFYIWLKPNGRKSLEPLLPDPASLLGIIH